MRSSSKLSRLAHTFFGLSVVLLGLLLFLSAAPAWSQATSTSTVAGQVTDQSNAVVPGAVVKLVDVITTKVLTTVSNETGRYIFVNVPSGAYTLEFSKEGFSVHRVTAQVEFGATVTINAPMKVGATTTTVEVSATAGAELQTSNAAVSNTIDFTAINLLPNLGRDASSLAVLQPGTTPTGYVAGVFNDQNTFQLDGGNNSSDMDGTQVTYTTAFASGGTPTGTGPVPVESIEQFKVTSFNQTSDFNGGVGAQVQMETKRGSNQFHGSLYEYYYATNVGAANSWANEHKLINDANCPKPAAACDATPLPSNHRNRFGASIGGYIPKANFVGGKTYFFFLFEGFRFPNVSNYEPVVPTDMLKAGIVQINTSGSNWTAYNLNPHPVTVNGQTYAPAVCPGGACDPRSLGINPIVTQVWKMMPSVNDLANAGDHYNTGGFNSTIRAPQRSNSYVGRLDHDFGSRNRFFTSYRFTRFVQLNTAQVDIGGALPGDTFGQPAATAPRDQLPSYWVAGLTSTISPRMTNDFRFNFTRNFWQWGTFGAPPQVAGLGGALEIGGESSGALIPYNVNTQNVRKRFWDGLDKQIKDDITMIKGNHLIQFGGTYARNYESHQRDDNGQSTFTDPTYVSTNSGVNFPTAYVPAGIPSNQVSTYTNYYSEIMGIVSLPQTVFVRAGQNLALQPPGIDAVDHSILPYYNVYFSDTWHLKPTFTLTYGLGWALDMPPYEVDGKQVEVVDSSGQQINAADFFAQRQSAALAGQVYDPIIGFATVRNVGSGKKYPFNPYYAGFSPRVSAAWNPKFTDGILGKVFGDGKTVIRGGYGRIFGRLNGVSLVLVPLLGTGLLQTVQCSGASLVTPGVPSTGQCLGSGVVNPTNAFRVGPLGTAANPGWDGLVAPLPQPGTCTGCILPTLPQPYYAGTNGLAAAGDGSTLDPNYRPNRTDNFTISIQREISNRATLEIGYLGRLLRNEFAEKNLDSVPYMTTLNGQSFAQAYASIFFPMRSALNQPSSSPLSTAQLQAVANGLPAQPFFEAALGGPKSAYCSGFSSCTAAVAYNQRTAISNTQVSDLWKALNAAPSWTLGRTMLDANPLQVTSIGLYGPFGRGNYNAAFATVRTHDWHGMTAISNFTWGRALGTGDISQATSSATQLDAWNLQAYYGTQSFDIKFIYNASLYYQPQIFRGQKGVLGHILGGWTIAPIFSAQSGSPIRVSYSETNCTGCQAFGEVTPPGSVTANEGAVGVSQYTGTTNNVQYHNSGTTSALGIGVGTTNPTGINMFADPAAIYSEFRPCVLGFDTNCGGAGNLRGLPSWNLDATVAKDIAFHTERIGATLVFQFTNVLNHVVMSNPSLSLTSPQSFGNITAQANSPRQLEFGLRVHF